MLSYTKYYILKINFMRKKILALAILALFVYSTNLQTTNAYVDKTSLQEKINSSILKDKSGFSTESWDKYQRALQNALNVLNSSSPTQNDITNAINNIISAENNLSTNFVIPKTKVYVKDTYNLTTTERDAIKEKIKSYNSTIYKDLVISISESEQKVTVYYNSETIVISFSNLLEMSSINSNTTTDSNHSLTNDPRVTIYTWESSYSNDYYTPVEEKVWNLTKVSVAPAFIKYADSDTIMKKVSDLLKVELETIYDAVAKTISAELEKLKTQIITEIKNELKAEILAELKKQNTTSSINNVSVENTKTPEKSTASSIAESLRRNAIEKNIVKLDSI